MDSEECILLVDSLDYYLWDHRVTSNTPDPKKLYSPYMFDNSHLFNA